MKTIKKVLAVVAVLLVAAVCGLGIYFGKGSPADQNARNSIEHPAAGVTVDATKNGQIIFMPEDGTLIGIVFYPGAGVHYDAYAELAERFAEDGYMCALVHMPLNLAVLNENAADAVIAEYPDITKWYICGHSMGGSAAVNYSWKHQDQLNGLILLASRIRRDFSQSDLPVLLISATEDGICMPERLKSGIRQEPAVFTHIVIEGGCHGYFGSYGNQLNDGIPTISREAQMDQTAEGVRIFIEGNKD